MIWHKKITTWSSGLISNKRHVWGRLLSLVFACLLFSPLLQANAPAANRVIKFDIAEMDAGLSLLEFAEQANVTLLVPFELVKGKKTKALTGWYSISNGVTILLAETGLVAKLNDKGAIAISLAKNEQRATAQVDEKEPRLNALTDTEATTKQVLTGKQAKANNDDVEVITIKGIRGSLAQSINVKRFSEVIQDSVAAEDIGQLPDENIAEVLQRITGIQMTRAADGEGTSIQIRGISDNNVEINGQSVTGSRADRNINFQDIPSELFSAIEVLKAQSSDQIEGSLGGTVNLKTRRPLNIKNEQVGNITIKAKYNQLEQEVAPDFNGFFSKNWRGTEIGDIGFIVNLGSKKVMTQTDVYGGGDFETAPAVWFVRDGSGIPSFGRPVGEPDNNPFLNQGSFGNASDNWGIDVNQDGVIDNNDRYYMPGNFRTYSRYAQSQRDALNFTSHWQPNDKLEVFLDYSKTKNQELLLGSQLSMSLNAARSFILPQYEHNIEQLVGNAFLVKGGYISGANVRMGGAPSNKNTWRNTEKVTIGGEYTITENVSTMLSYSQSKGQSSSDQAQLTLGYDWNKDQELNILDWAGIISYDLKNGGIPDATLYESPFYPSGLAPNSISDLVALDPTEVNYDRLNYFQMLRNASDTNNSDKAFKFDLEYQHEGAIFSQFKLGMRQATRTFQRASYMNTNQNKAEIIGDLTKRVDIQDVKVNPRANSDPRLANIAIDLQQCFSRDSIDVGNSNLPSSWLATRCSSDFFTSYFKLHDIRAFDPQGGSGLYENEGERYQVEEQTKAIYFRAGFNTDVGQFPLFGNLGVRYVKTKTSSTGYLNNPPDAQVNFSQITLPGEYDDTLPSLNINLGLDEQTLLRFAAYKSIGRPELTVLSPGIRLNYNLNLEDGYAGTADIGNPDLAPIRSTNLDLSYEWYYRDNNMFSLALFQKQLDSVIFTDAEQRVDVEIDGQLFSAIQPQNQQGTKIKGYELSMQHAFSELSGLLAYTGIAFNYTYTAEDTGNFDAEGDEIGRRGLSKNSLNLVTYYDDNAFSIRLAYNWRDDFVRRESVALGFNRPDVLPEIEKARGQLDLSANYKLTDALKISFSAVNLNNSKAVRFMKHEALVNYIGSVGTRYNLGIAYRF